MIPAFIQPHNTAEAVAIQQSLATALRLADDFGIIRTIAGIDVGYDTRRNLGRAAIALVDADTCALLYSCIAYAPVAFPYVPGLLSFREVPVILAAYRTLPVAPDLLMVDGHGIAHPRRLGIAAHIGILCDKPAIGVAKKRLCGTYIEPAPQKGQTSPLYHRQEQVGTVLRSRDNTKPLFVSPGHRISQATAAAIVMAQLGGFRLPEPTRLADKLSKHGA